ncbi:unnamed protein product [Rotaria sp. Silwood2]|nr:unnamed protein product [Rotaria sp. Silwood2]CAF3216136.1 unnamed protein product [Rotaria sp. Silwood2]CAF4602280.1 unnamed protein product [Rotaria sp. Silwood2]
MQNQYCRTIGRTKTIIKEGDYLCTGCFNVENINMNKKYGTLIESQVDFDEIIDEVNDNNFSYSMNSEEEPSYEEDGLAFCSSPSKSTIEYSYSEMEPINILNAVFDLLKIERITDTYAF